MVGLGKRRFPMGAMMVEDSISERSIEERRVKPALSIDGAQSSLPMISIVVPVFNEEASIAPFLERIIPILEDIGPQWEVIFVNDGSRDGTLDAIRRAHVRDARVLAIDFSRNFGKEIALCAGLDHTLGKVVVPIDVDLQDPPELIHDMLAQWRAGFDVVLAKRVDRSDESWLKRSTAAGFYSLIGRLSKVPIPSNVGDFRLLDAKVVEAVRGYRERTRFMKGIFASLGYKTCVLPYVRAPRATGESKFQSVQLFRLALEGIISFSDLPLKIWTYIGGLASLGAILYACFILMRTLILGIEVPGYASLIIFMLISNGLTLMGLGIQGEYLARIFSEVKARPLYLVRETIGVKSTALWLNGKCENTGTTQPV